VYKTVFCCKTTRRVPLHLADLTYITS